MSSTALQKLARQRIIQGLSSTPRQLYPALFYDAAGSEIYEEITRTADYYPTRTEIEILRKHGASIASAVGPDALLIEPGCGACTKSALLLRMLKGIHGYVAIDVSAEMLFRAAEELRSQFPELNVQALEYDFSAGFFLTLPRGRESRRLIYYAGSSIGNLHPNEAVEFLRQLSEICKPGDQLLIGVDQKKHPALLHAAYNDSEGATERFHKNLLQRLSRDFGARLDADHFDHYAFYNPGHGRIEMHLSANRNTSISFEERSFEFREGQSLVSEYSYKYTPAEFNELAARAGWQARQLWQDDRRWFALSLFQL